LNVSNPHYWNGSSLVGITGEAHYNWALANTPFFECSDEVCEQILSIARALAQRFLLHDRTSRRPTIFVGTATTTISTTRPHFTLSLSSTLR
jgi:hypothetical protein